MKYILKAIATFEGIDHKSRYDVAGQAQSYLSRGMAVMSLANHTTSMRRKVGQLHEARSWYERSLATWQQEPGHDSKDPFGKEEGQELSPTLRNAMRRFPD